MYNKIGLQQNLNGAQFNLSFVGSNLTLKTSNLKAVFERLNEKVNLIKFTA